METRTREQSVRTDQPDTVPVDSGGSVGWTYARALYNRRRFIAGVTLLAAVVAVGIALVVPRQYAAEARLLKPEGGDGLSLGALIGSAASLPGGFLTGGGEYARYLAILTSRSMMNTIIDEFDLVAVYDMADVEYPYPAAREELRGNVEFEVDLEYDFLTIRAFDQDPERAAQITDALVEELGEEYARLTSESARRTRLAVESRVRQAESSLDSARADLQRFQEQHGITELDAQVQALMQTVAQIKASAAELGIEYRTLASQFGADNPRAVSMRAARDAADAEATRLLNGRDAALPVALVDLPELGRQYAELLQEQIIQTTVLEGIYPLYEQALFREQGEAQAVQVVDAAEVPRLPARPSRRLLVVVLTLSAFLLVSLYVVARTWAHAHLANVAAKITTAHPTHAA